MAQETERLIKTSTAAATFQFSKFKLRNGLRVIISEDHAAPTYSLSITYDVGSRNERPGRTGFAHLFEHMMFQGSENVGKGEHHILVENYGGQTGGGTTQDRTIYFINLPSNQLELGLFLESDRMRSLEITRANLDNQRKAVQEEKRLNYDNKPYGKTNDAILDAAYDNFAYKHSAIGSMEDLNAATVQEAEDFFRTYYAPNNAVLTLVGDVKTDEVLAKIKKYFESIPAQPPPPTIDIAEPEQKTERRRIVEDLFASAPIIDIAFKIPAANTPDFYALSVLGSILSGGRSSRLYQKLVKQEQIATGVFAGPEPRRGPTLFSISIDAQANTDLSKIEQLVYAEIEKLINEPVADWEMEKARLRLRNNRAQSFQSTLSRALLIGRYAVDYNEPNLINDYEAKFNAVTKDDVKRVARVYFKESNRTVVTTLPKPATESNAVINQTPEEKSPTQTNSLESGKVERKNRAPVSNELLRVKLPQPVEATFENGLTVLILEDRRFPVINMHLSVGGAGAIYEPAAMHGLANATAQMLREGTQSRYSRQIAEEIEQLGATFTVSSNYGSTDVMLNASGLSDNFDQWFNLFTDILMNPSFPAEELAKLKTRLELEFKEQRADPAFLANERFKAAVFGSHPASVVTTTPEALEKLTTRKLAEWHRIRYTPQNSILAISGNVSAAEILPKLKRAFGLWKQTSFRETLPPPPKVSSNKRIFLVDRPGSVQATIIMGNIVANRRSPDYISLVVMDSIVGAGDSSRLFLNLREDKGYTYGAYSDLITQKYAGVWSVGGDFRNEVTEGALTEFLKELHRIRNERVSQSELDEKKRSLIARFALSLENPGQLLDYAMIRKFDNLPSAYWETYPAKILQVSFQDVKLIAQKYVKPDEIQIVVVGDAAKIKQILEKFGPVEIFSTQGKHKNS